VYASHFGLTDDPFSITPDPDYLYLSPQHREGLAHLRFAMRQPGGFVVLTGEVGTGKTLLCRAVLRQLPNQVDAALILNPLLTALELLAAVCDELGVEYPAGTHTIKDLVDAIYRRLLNTGSRGCRTALIIDEAQNLSAGVLEQLRLLTNLETPTHKLLQLILIGQPELLQHLKRPQVRQFAQRITAHYHLRPFARRDTYAYVRHRARVAGGGDDLFSWAALYMIHRVSGGVPRLINVLSDRALLAAYVNRRRHVGLASVRQAIRELRDVVRCWRPRRPTLARTAGGLVAALAMGGIVAGVGGFRLPMKETQAPAPVVAVAQAAGPAPGPAELEPRPRLAGLLDGSTVPWDEHAAFATLFRGWGVQYQRPRRGSACDVVNQPRGFECLLLTGTWDRLRRLDMPAVLDLVMPDGKRWRVALVAVRENEATLDLGGTEYSFPLEEIDPTWTGNFTLVWRPPAIRSRLISVGMRGPDVIWLRDRLDELPGAVPAHGSRATYDEGLMRRVMAFQRSRFLIADGVVGEETLVQLMRAVGEANMPSLTRDTHARDRRV
jgi:general secretion pathway protein A